MRVLMLGLPTILLLLTGTAATAEAASERVKVEAFLRETPEEVTLSYRRSECPEGVCELAELDCVDRTLTLRDRTTVDAEAWNQRRIRFAVSGVPERGLIPELDADGSGSVEPGARLADSAAWLRSDISRGDLVVTVGERELTLATSGLPRATFARFAAACAYLLAHDPPPPPKDEGFIVALDEAPDRAELRYEDGKCEPSDRDECSVATLECADKALVLTAFYVDDEAMVKLVEADFAATLSGSAGRLPGTGAAVDESDGGWMPRFLVPNARAWLHGKAAPVARLTLPGSPPRSLAVTASGRATFERFAAACDHLLPAGR